MDNNTVSFDTVRCPVCSSRSGTYSISVGSYNVIKCPNCGLEYTSPNPSDNELCSFYNNYIDIRANPEITTLNAKRNLDLLRAYGLKEQSTILDFGCGNGEFVEVAGSRCFGVDWSTEKNRARIANDINTLPIDKYDFITMWGVLEHLNDPVQILKKLTERLREGGRVALTTVNAEGLIPYYYKPPEHLTYWTAKAIRCLFEKNGFLIKDIHSYEMYQFSKIYLDRLLSRTPDEYRHHIAASYTLLPNIVKVPTNEFLVVAELMLDHKAV